MADFDDSIEFSITDFGYEMADEYVVPLTQFLFGDTIELLLEDLLATEPSPALDGFYYNPLPAIFDAAIELQLTDFFALGSEYLTTPSQLALFTPGIELSFFSIPPLPGDDSVELGFEGPEVRRFPNMAGVEILYSDEPINVVNKVLTKMDSQEWRVAGKTLSTATRRNSRLRFRVDSVSMVEFMGDLHSNIGAQFRLTTPGRTPFGVNSQDNYVMLLDYSSPTPESGGLTWLVDASFRFLSVFA